MNSDHTCTFAYGRRCQSTVNESVGSSHCVICDGLGGVCQFIVITLRQRLDFD